MKELKFAPKMTAFSDNLPALKVAKAACNPKQINQLERDYFFVQDMIDARELEVFHCEGKYQAADGLTKCLPKTNF